PAVLLVAVLIAEASMTACTSTALAATTRSGREPVTRTADCAIQAPASSTAWLAPSSKNTVAPGEMAVPPTVYLRFVVSMAVMLVGRSAAAPSKVTVVWLGTIGGGNRSAFARSSTAPRSSPLVAAAKIRGSVVHVAASVVS